jgi:hypothetical protein
MEYLVTLSFVLYAVTVTIVCQALAFDNAHHPESFLKIYNNYADICGNPQNNLVLPRYDGFTLDLEWYRNWSVSSHAIHNFVNIDPHTHIIKQPRKLCASFDEVARAMDYSTYLSENAFDPASICQISWYNQSQICDLINRYSVVFWEGDSLTRHQYQAMMMILREDFRYGGLPAPVNYKVVSQCACDGQLSEALSCRTPMYYEHENKASFLTKQESLTSIGLCSKWKAPDHRHAKFYWFPQNNPNIPVSCPATNKPILVYYQSGIHCGTNVEHCSVRADKFIKSVKATFANCTNKIHYIFSGATVSSTALVKRYPGQADEFVATYNANMTKWFQDHYPDVKPINFFNLTKEGNSRTSDGLHSLTDVALMKAMTVLNLMSHLLAV